MKNQGSDIVRPEIQLVFSVYARTVSSRRNSRPSSKEFVVALWGLEYHATEEQQI